MIKGCTKRVVVVKDVQSDMFEEAYFILKPQSAKRKGPSNQGAFLTEANRLVSQNCDLSGVFVKSSGQAKKHSILRDVLFFMSGVAVAGCSFALFI